MNLGAWVEMRHKCRDLDMVEMGPGLSWDAHLETWIGWYETGTELRYNSPVKEGPVWRWDTHFETCMRLRWCLDGTKMQFGEPELSWDVTWMQARCKYQDPDWGEIQLAQKETWIWERGWRWNKNFDTLMGVRSDLDWDGCTFWDLDRVR